jgi:hypothetical protein
MAKAYWIVDGYNIGKCWRWELFFFTYLSFTNNILTNKLIIHLDLVVDMYTKKNYMENFQFCYCDQSMNIDESLDNIRSIYIYAINTPNCWPFSAFCQFLWFSCSTFQHEISIAYTFHFYTSFVLALYVHCKCALYLLIYYYVLYFCRPILN